jgi:signal transduction histidine kinase
MLESEQQLSESGRQTLARIKRAATDMEELIEAFLLLARESDQALANELVDINDVVEDEIDRVQLISHSKHLNINYTPTQQLMVWASGRVLSVLFGNLLRNAVLYTDHGSVDVSITGNSVIIKDSGKGMPEQQVNEIFKPYYRGDHSNTVGHGVGLTIVKRLSDRFNWPITITSALNEGTCVEVRFPEAESSSLA